MCVFHSTFYLLFTVSLSTSPSLLFFFNDTATTEIYTLSLHDALPISFLHAHHGACRAVVRSAVHHRAWQEAHRWHAGRGETHAWGPAPDRCVRRQPGRSATNFL